MRKTNFLVWISILVMMIVLSGCAAPQQSTKDVPAAVPQAAPDTQVSAAPSATAPSPAIPAAAGTPTGQAEIPNSGGTPAAGTPAATQSAAISASCTSPAAATPPMTEGPYFKAGSPEQPNLVQPGMGGTKLTLTGTVLDTSCQPIAHALLDFWQADAQGQYDNAGYTLRGHVYTDAAGRYKVETVIPGLYPGRTEHIHVKVQPPGGAVLTTQLFFPGVTQNQSDQIFDQRLLVDLQDGPDGKIATYTFILQK